MIATLLFQAFLVGAVVAIGYVHISEILRCWDATHGG